MKAFYLISSLAVLLALAVAGALVVWNAMEDVAISLHGWIALGASVLVTLALGSGLMFLVFYSSRRGFDDPDK